MAFPISSEDLCVWPDDTYCYRSEIEQYTWMSDDFMIISVHNTALYEEFSIQLGLQ